MGGGRSVLVEHQKGETKVLDLMFNTLEEKALYFSTEAPRSVDIFNFLDIKEDNATHFIMVLHR